MVRLLLLLPPPSSGLRQKLALFEVCVFLLHHFPSAACCRASLRPDGGGGGEKAGRGTVHLAKGEGGRLKAFSRVQPRLLLCKIQIVKQNLFINHLGILFVYLFFLEKAKKTASHLVGWKENKRKHRTKISSVSARCGNDNF